MTELGQFAPGFAEYRKMLAAVPEQARLPIFINAANEAAGYVAKGLDRAAAADELADMATAHGLNDADAVQWVISRAFERVEQDIEHVPDLAPEIAEPLPEQRINGKYQPGLRLLSKAEFVKGFVPPDYLIDGMLQRRFVYSLTGVTGHAKSAIALLVSELVSSADRNAMLGIHKVGKGQVVYFVGENPDDIRMRVIGADSKRPDDDKPLNDRIIFIPGVFNIGEMFAKLHAELNRRGSFDLIIVDTSAAYFLGADEISNTQMGAHARMLRRLTELPGGPCVLVLCHPIKHAAEPNQLLPRGGGAFLAEMDGNLTSWKDGDLIELHHNKMRGPGFEPITFKLETIWTDRLTDAKGRQIPTVRAIVIPREAEERLQHKTREDEDLVLTKLLANPDASIADIAEACGWMYGGEPAKSKVHRALDKMTRTKPLLVRKERGRWELTEEGKKTARTAALAFAQREQNASQTAMAF